MFLKSDKKFVHENKVKKLNKSNESIILDIMKSKQTFRVFVFLYLLVTGIRGFCESKPVNLIPSSAMLPVPFITEAPSGIFAGPWKNACEEASIAMVEWFYSGKNPDDIKAIEAFMLELFKQQNLLYGSNANSDAKRTVELINLYTSFTANIVENPTMEDIKREINQGRPVITPNYGFGLNNPNIPFLSTGSSYHMVVITGYDDEKDELITNDSGDFISGRAHRYAYDVFMQSVHDYDYTRNKADGPAFFIFTKPKL